MEEATITIEITASQAQAIIGAAWAWELSQENLHEETLDRLHGAIEALGKAATSK